MSGEHLWDLPASWTWARFADVADVRLELEDAKRFPTAVHIAPNHIESGTARLLEQGTVAGDKVAGPKHRFTRGQVLYSKIRPYLAKAVIAPCDGFCSSDMYPVDARCSPEFLVRWLVSPAFTARVSRDQNRTVLPKVNLATLRELPVPVPPPSEQHRIIAKLEAVQARSRRAREALDAVTPLLEKLRQSILAAAFRGDLTKDWRAKNKNVEPASKLLDRIRAEHRKKWEESELAKLKSKGKAPADDRWKSNYKKPASVDSTGRSELPEGWCWATLAEVAPLQPGFAFPSAGFRDQGVRLLKGVNVRDGWVSTDELDYWEPEDSAGYAPFLLHEGDIVLAMDRPVYSSGTRATKVVQLDEAWEGSLLLQRVGRFQRVPSLRADYLLLALRSDWFRDHLIRKQNGTQDGKDLPHVSAGVVDAAVLPIPPADEQAEIAQRANARLNALRVTEQASSSGRERLGTLERAILAKAFRGELVPQDSSDMLGEALSARVHSIDLKSANRYGTKDTRPPKKRTPSTTGGPQNARKTT